MSPKACSYGKRHRPQDNPRAGPARELAAPGVNVAHSGSRPSVTVCFLKRLMIFQTWFASPQATSLHGFTADQTRQPSSSAMNEDERGGCGRGRCTREASRVRAWRKNHSPRARALPLSLRTALIFSHVSWQRARHPVVPTRAVRCRRLTLSALTLNYESALTLSFSLSPLSIPPPLALFPALLISISQSSWRTRSNQICCERCTTAMRSQTPPSCSDAR